jgi:hypothetical protein
MRHYRLHCIDCRASHARAPETVFDTRDFEADDLQSAFGAACKAGYWPLSMVASGWSKAELDTDTPRVHLTEE